MNVLDLLEENFYYISVIYPKKKYFEAAGGVRYYRLEIHAWKGKL